MTHLSRAQSREVDRIAMEEFKIPGILLMENAARGIAEAISRRFPGIDGTIAIVCGPGNNGGDGFAAARHLANAGRQVRIHLALPPEIYPDGSDAAINLEIARAMAIPTVEGGGFDDARLLVDAVFGTGLRRTVREPIRALLVALEAAPAPIVAIDLPSGLDADTGTVLGVAPAAQVTLTMVAPKAGFRLAEGPRLVGEVEVIGIGAPPEAIARAIATA